MNLRMIIDTTFNSDNIWLDIIIVIPFSLFSFNKRFLISTIPSGSTAFIGSSNIKSFGLKNKDNPNENLCFIPKE